MKTINKINYLEYPAKCLVTTKVFFKEVFDWKFTDYGEDYIAFIDSSGINGGFYKSDLFSSAKNGAALTVFYSDNIKDTQTKVEQAGGEIIHTIFAFPGGVRFHFNDPNGNEFAVWSETHEAR